MKVLILSCNTGEGHNYAGRALKECIESHHDTADTVSYTHLRAHETSLHAGRALKECIESHHDTADMLDIMMLAGPRVSKLVGNSYVNIVRHAPRLFQCLYKLGGLVSSSRHHSPVYYANALLAKKLKHYLDTHHYDIIVTPHLFPAQTLTYMKEKNLLSQKIVAIETDYTCIPFWEETDCDYYIIPHYELIDEFAAKGIPRERLKPYGIPVRPAFSDKSDRQKARVRCRIPKHAQVYLIMSGSMGFGKIQLFVAELLRTRKPGEYVVVICGNNRRLQKILLAEFGKQEGVQILGYTEKIADFMAATDVLFTKPGGLTTTEAAVKGIPIVHTRPIPGCETKNLAFYTERGLSLTSKKLHGQILAGRKLMSNDELRHSMCTAQHTIIPSNAAEKTYRLLCQLSSAHAISDDTVKKETL